jgi:hypothetical protein
LNRSPKKVQPFFSEKILEPKTPKNARKRSKKKIRKSVIVCHTLIAHELIMVRISVLNDTLKVRFRAHAQLQNAERAVAWSPPRAISDSFL